MRKTSKNNFVVVPGSSDLKARIYKEKWLYKGKKRSIIVVKDERGRNIARTTKLTNLEQAKERFEKNGSFTIGKKVSFYNTSKRVSYDKTPRSYNKNRYSQITASVILPDGRRIVKSSHKFKGDDREAIKREKDFVDEKIYSEISQHYGENYQEFNGKRIAQTKNLKVVYGVERWEKR